MPLEPNSDGLSLRGIGKQFGPIRVIEGIDLDVRPGEVVALLGENGAGKSTLSSIIAGVFPPSEGTMTWHGAPYAPASPGDAISAGIGLIHQEMRLLPDLSIAENVFVGRLPMRGGRIDRAAMNRRAGEQLKRLGLDVPPKRLVRTLRVAAQQQVEIAKALTLEARLLILDEPTAALGGDETDRLFAQVDRLRREGVSFIYISHRLDDPTCSADPSLGLRQRANPPSLIPQHLKSEQILAITHITPDEASASPASFHRPSRISRKLWASGRRLIQATRGICRIGEITRSLSFDHFISAS